MNYNEKLENAKAYYPFDEWRESFFPDPEDENLDGMSQYTEENCNAAKVVIDKLINGLKLLGENAPKKDKVGIFKTAVEELNGLDDKICNLIETGEREDLCELFDQITIAAGLNPKDYGDGNGIADEWRNW